MLTGSDVGHGGPHSSGAAQGRDTATPEGVLGFWFAPGGEDRWFKPDPAFDTEIGTHFAHLVEAALAGRLDGWAATPDGALALCLLLDQFPRNIWRGTPRAFACDALARAVATAAVAAGHDRAVPKARRHFFYLPFEHSEDLADQERCLTLMGPLDYPDLADWSRRHRDVIARFGRFPHRNAILGRESTAEEIEFLQQPGSSF
jgi:uncharacterized protein (DUF924 family)